MNSKVKEADLSSRIILGFYSILILIIPYFRGLFFDTDLYKFELLIGILFIVAIILSSRMKNMADGKSAIIYPLLFLVTLYFITAFLGNAPLLSFQEAFRWLIYGLTFIGLLIILKPQLNQVLLHVVFLSISWIALFGLLAQFELVTFKDAIWGGRIASVLQYPNTLAALIGALMVGILLYTVNVRVKGFVKLSYLTLMVPLTIVFIFTQSRATLLLLPMAWFVGLFFLNVRQQLEYLLKTILLAMAVIPILLIYDSFLQNTDPSIIMISFAAGLLYAILSVGSGLIVKRMNFKNSRSARFILPVCMVIIGIITFSLINIPAVVKVMPVVLQERLSDINLETKSVTERGTFYKDSWLLFKENWLIGTGGNGWRALFMTVQSLPYYSTQTHSFAMKLLVEVGLLGTIVFFIFMGILLFTIYRWVKKYGFRNERMLNLGIPFTMALMLLIHSLVDFDMSYGYFALMWFTLLAMVYVEVREEDTEIKFNRPILAKTTMWGTVAVSVFTMIFIARFAYAEMIPVNNLPADVAVANVGKKIKLNPVNTEYRFQKMLVMEIIAENTNNPEAIKAGLQEGLKIAEIEKHNPQSLIKVAQYFAKHGYGMDALKLSKQALDQAPWFLDAYEQYFALASPASLHLIKEGNEAEAKKYIEDISQRLTELEEKRKYLDTMPESLRYPEFQLTEIIRRYGGQALVLNGEYDRAVQYMSPLTGSQAPEVKEDALLWLSIAYDKSGKQQEAMQMVQEGRQLNPAFDQKRGELLTLVEKYRGQ